MSEREVRQGASPRRALTVGVAVVLLLGTAYSLLPDALTTDSDLPENLVQLGAAALAAGCTGWRARRSGAVRRSWAALAAACACWAAGQAVWTWLTERGRDPFPSVADAGYLAFGLLACLALLLHPGDSRAPQRVQRGLDATMTASAVLLVSWQTVLGPVVGASAAEHGLAAAVLVAYPVLDVVVLVLTVLTLARTSSPRAPLVLVAAGLVSLSVADSAFALLQATGDYAAAPDTSWLVGLPDAAWVLGFGCLALAALVPGGARRAATGTAPARPPAAGFLPYLPVVAALAVSVLLQTRGHSPTRAESTVAALLVVLLLARQYVTLRQNARLATRIAAREAQLRHQAFHDALTGLANRSLFRDRVEHALDLHRRDLRPVAVLVLDLDDFKVVNDTLGHAVGDQVLVRVSERMRGAVRTGDTVARLGGDEFGVLLEDGGDPYAAADRIAGVLRVPFGVGHRQLVVRASTGVVELAPPDTTPSVDELLARADTAMYAAKRSGKGRIVAHTAGMSLVELEDQRFRERFCEAITERAVRLAYQPIVALDGRRVVGFEALARWRHEGRDVPPEAFIRAATRTGVLPDLTDALLAEACGQLATWTERWDGHCPLTVHVNVAPSQLVAPGFLDTVGDLVARHGVGRGQLKLEITESDVLADVDTAQAAIAGLRRLGVGVSLDDFGVGYSSLSRLTDIALDSVKIDRSLVDRIDTDPRRATFLGGLLRLAEDLGLPVIAEGVERPAQLAELERLGCPLAQGYLLGRPVDAAAATRLLELPAAGVPTVRSGA